MPPTRDTDLQQRFEVLLQQHRAIVVHVARIYAGAHDERHDLAQEICTQLWRAFPAYDPARRFSTWMYRVALNVGISHLREASLRAAHFEPWDEELAETVAGAPAAPQDERLAALRGLIAGLEPLNRALLLLYLEERSYAEIAEVLGLSETHVATKLHRIKQRWREQMAPTSLPVETPDGTR
jgi:RNA polymerase sigma-70 factor (ECF subfamily)